MLPFTYPEDRFKDAVGSLRTSQLALSQSQLGFPIPKGIPPERKKRARNL
jgi:hypothetical protein